MYINPSQKQNKCDRHLTELSEFVEDVITPLFKMESVRRKYGLSYT